MREKGLCDWCWCPFIGERSGGEICIALRALVCLSLYICVCVVYVWPDNQYHARPHCERSITLTPDIAQRKP